MRVAIVDDDQDIAALIQAWLEEEGHGCSYFRHGNDFIKTIKNDSFDLVLLDWLMPEIDGEQILTTLKSQEIDVPVIFVTQKTTEDDVAKILTLGADDYITKPVRRKELIARMGAVVRRIHPEAESEAIEMGNYRIELQTRAVLCDGELIKLTEKEFRLVHFLFKNVGRLLSRNHILSAVWGYESGINTRTVDTHMSRIRKKLDLVPEKGWRLSSIYHQGYRLEQVSGP